MTSLDYSTPVRTLSGAATDLTEYTGKVLVVVNTASRCGLTPQYEGLQELYDRYRGDGLVVLGFPCDQFGGQEPGSADQIADFCQVNYGVTFPMFEKIEVNGPGTHPLFQQLKLGAPGVLGSQRLKWNFTKFLVGRDGTILRRFAPTTTPREIESLIVTALSGRAAA